MNRELKIQIKIMDTEPSVKSRGENIVPLYVENVNGISLVTNVIHLSVKKKQ